MPWAKCVNCGQVVRYPGWRGFKLKSQKCPNCGALTLKRVKLDAFPEKYVDLAREWQEMLEFARLL
mgnify:CR=1 FL=1